MDPPCDAEALAKAPLFEHLSAEERARLAPLISRRRLAQGEQLFGAGEPGDSLFVVQDGEVELYIQDNSGEKITLAIAGSGEIFGELALLDRGPRTATAMALTDCELLELDRDHLLELFRLTPTAALHLLAALGRMTRKADELLRTRVVRNVNLEAAEQLSTTQRIVDAIADFAGNVWFLVLHAVWFGIWIPINTLDLGLPHFDPYPYGFLTLVVSLEAIFLSCFILISANRQAQKDRVRADIEYEINVKAELEVAHLHQKTDQIYAAMLERFARLEAKLGAQR